MRYLITLTLFLVLSCSNNCPEKCSCWEEVNENMKRNAEWIDLSEKVYGENVIIKLNKNHVEKMKSGIFKLWVRIIISEENKRVHTKYGKGIADYKMIIDCNKDKHLELAKFFYDKNFNLWEKTVYRDSQINDVPVRTFVSSDTLFHPVYNHLCSESK